MPTYNWDAISADGYRYIREKFRYAENFYDMVRIDHVVGLFRIWSIPYDEPDETVGLNGCFDPPDEGQWGDHGRDILSVMVKDTRMLLTAEDLGVIPKVCPMTLEKFGLPGNDVQRWVKDWETRHDFLEPKEYRPLAVAMLSTHDTTNWAAWWENEAGTVDEDLFVRKCDAHGIHYSTVRTRFFNQVYSRHGRLRWLKSVNSRATLAAMLGRREEEIGDFVAMYENAYREKEKLWAHLKLKGPMREKADRQIVRAALKVTLQSRAIFCIELLTDWLSLADIFKKDPYFYRINRPGTMSSENWSLVFPISLEGLLAHKVSGEIKEMVRSSGR